MQTTMVDRPVAAKETGPYAVDVDDAPGIVSFEARCDRVRGPAARARPGHAVRLAGSGLPSDHVVWDGPLLDGELRRGDRLAVSGTLDGQGRVHATRILNLSQGTVLQPLPRRLRAVVTGGLVAAITLLALAVAGAGMSVLL